MAPNPFKKGTTFYIIDYNEKESYGKSGTFVDWNEDNTKVELNFGNGWCGYFYPHQIKTKTGKEIYNFKGISVTTGTSTLFYGRLSYSNRGHNHEVVESGNDAEKIFSNLLAYFNKLPKRKKI